MSGLLSPTQKLLECTIELDRACVHQGVGLIELNHLHKVFCVVNNAILTEGRVHFGIQSHMHIHREVVLLNDIPKVIVSFDIGFQAVVVGLEPVSRHHVYHRLEFELADIFGDKPLIRTMKSGFQKITKGVQKFML